MIEEKKNNVQEATAVANEKGEEAAEEEEDEEDVVDMDDFMDDVQKSQDQLEIEKAKQTALLYLS